MERRTKLRRLVIACVFFWVLPKAILSPKRRLLVMALIPGRVSKAAAPPTSAAAPQRQAEDQWRPQQLCRVAKEISRVAAL